MPPKKQVIGDAGINFDALSAVVNDQLAKDAKYDRENDAKFRAVRQKVATYEEFENIVIGAHLKPMKEDIRELELKRSSWDSSGRARERTREREKLVALQALDAAGTPVERCTKSAQDFRRHWKASQAGADRYAYLLEVGPAKIKKFFKSGIDAFLGPFVGALEADYSPDDREVVIELLEAFSQSPRFSLAVDMAEEAERVAAERLFARLDEDAQAGASVKSASALKALFF